MAICADEFAVGNLGQDGSLPYDSDHRRASVLRLDNVTDDEIASC
jgi:hypothetical protein